MWKRTRIQFVSLSDVSY